jgi:hypothetical protein
VRGTLSVVCRTAKAGARPAAILAAFRPLADEILVAVDDRSDPGARSDVAAVADRVLVYPFAEPQNRTLPWLFAECRSDWAFVVDDDEIPSLALLAALPELLGDDALAHCSFPVRWLFPDPSTYLDDWPWEPHWAARLLRTDARLIRFGAQTHRPILVDGPGRFLPLPLWHADTVLRSHEERLEKARRYERSRPGMRIGGRAFNYAFYVPELRGQPPLAPLPDDERRHVESVLAAGPRPGPPTATTEEATRGQIDRHWPAGGAAVNDGRLELVAAPRGLAAGEERTVDVRVRNSGAATWGWGRDAVPEVRVGSRWLDAAGRELAELEIHTPFPAPLAPGGDDLVPVHVRAPEAPGDYRLSIGLILEHVGWFGDPVACDVTVRARRRIAVVGDDDAVADVAAVLAEIPELELVRLRRTPATAPGGYPEAPDGRAYLFDDAPAGRLAFPAALLWRSARLRAGPTPARAAGLVAALRGCELLAVGGLDGPEQRRERWALGVVERTARSLGLRVARTRDAAELAAHHGRERYAGSSSSTGSGPATARPPARAWMLLATSAPIVRSAPPASTALGR